MLKTILLFAIFVGPTVAELIDSCNQCFESNRIACLNETHFSNCFNNVPSTTVIKCPDDMVCTDDSLICRSAEESKPVCVSNQDDCGECAATNGVFACLNETTYGYCFGDKNPPESTFSSCRQGFVCSQKSKDICVPEATHEPTCGKKTNSKTKKRKTTETTSTQEPQTTEKPKNQDKHRSRQQKAKDICNKMNKTGAFSFDDATCRKFVFCYPLSSKHIGMVHYCNGYFNASTRKCQLERPANCTAI